MGVPFTAAHGSIRFSLSVYNTQEEVDFIIENLPPIIANLRRMSPFWNQSQGGAQDTASFGDGTCVVR
jgi:cysteine desulfurase